MAELSPCLPIHSTDLSGIVCNSQFLSDEAAWKRLNPDPPDNYVPDAHERYIIRLEAEAQARGVKPY